MLLRQRAGGLQIDLPDLRRLAPALRPNHLRMPKWAQASSGAITQPPARRRGFQLYG